MPNTWIFFILCLTATPAKHICTKLQNIKNDLYNYKNINNQVEFKLLSGNENRKY